MVLNSSMISQISHGIYISKDLRDYFKLANNDDYKHQFTGNAQIFSIVLIGWLLLFLTSLLLGTYLNKFRSFQPFVEFGILFLLFLFFLSCCRLFCNLRISCLSYTFQEFRDEMTNFPRSISPASHIPQENSSAF